jgi:hypothetical protein
MTYRRRALLVAAALGAMALAAAAAYAAREAGRVDDAMRESDTAFRVEPAREGLWQVEGRSRRLAHLIGLKDDLAFRTASRRFELLRRRGRDPYDFAARAFRANAQLALAEARRAGLSRHTASRAANLEGILALEEALGDPRNGPALIERSLAGFRRALAIDQANEEAAFNLELVLRLLEPSAARLQIRYNVNARGRGVAGAAALRSGAGY